MFMAIALVAFAAIALTIPMTEPIILMILVLIIAGLLVEGYPQIHDVLTGNF
jgi:hypothetical protein